MHVRLALDAPFRDWHFALSEAPIRSRPDEAPKEGEGVVRRKRREPRVKFGGPNPLMVYWVCLAIGLVGIPTGQEMLLWGAAGVGTGYFFGVLFTSGSAYIEYVDADDRGGSSPSRRGEGAAGDEGLTRLKADSKDSGRPARSQSASPATERSASVAPRLVMESPRVVTGRHLVASWRGASEVGSLCVR